MMKKFSTEFRIAAIIIGILCIVILTGVWGYFSLTRVVEKVSDSARPDMRLALMEQLLANLAHAESSVKSYNLTRDEVYLTPFYRSLSTIDGQVASLKKLSAKNDSTYIALTDSIEQLIEKKYQVLSDILSLGNNERVTDELKRIAAQAELSTLMALQKMQEKKEVTVKTKRNIFQRVFTSKKKKKKEDTIIISPSAQPVISKVKKDITRQVAVVKNEQIRQLKSLKQQELQLLKSDKQIMAKIRSLVSHMQYLEKKRIIMDAALVSNLVQKTNNRIIAFSVSITVLLLIVSYTLVTYIQKNKDYTAALNYAKHEAENLAKTKETFLANMSHEIRTPMNAIAGFTDQLLQSNLPKQQQEQVQIIKNSSSHLLGVLNEILDYSKLMAGKIVLSNEAFNPAKEITNVCNTLKIQADKKTIALKVDIPETNWCSGDAVRLNQILFNIIGNAIKFTDKGEVRVTATTKDVNQDSTGLTVFVADTGIGIAQKDLGKIYNEFEQADDSISGRFGGTGLGLSISKKLVELQGGKLIVNSTIGKGTEVIIFIPYKKSTQSKIEKNETLVLDGVMMNKHVLVADDNAYNRELLITILNKWQAKITVVVDGKMAWEKVKSDNFDLLLLDIRMPGLKGDVLAQQVRNIEDEHKRKVPIIALTAAVSAEEKLSYKNHGIDGTLNKPFNEQELYHTIKELFPQLLCEVSVRVSSQEVVANSVGKHYSSKDLYSMGDEQFVKDMLQVFVDTTTRGMQNLDNNCKRKNWSAVADTAHQMIPSCRHMEANTLMNILKNIETEIRDNNRMNQIPDLVTQAKNESKLLLQEIKQEINRNA